MRNAALFLLVFGILAGCGGGGGNPSQTNTCSASEYLPNYVADLQTACNPACAVSLFRWDTMPVRIFRVNGGAWSASLVQSYMDAMQRWKTVSGNQVQFIETAFEGDAHITFEFVNAGSVAPNAVGITTLTTRGGSLIKAEIKVATQRFSGGGARPQADVASTSTHELGHALGISGHSPSLTDVMYASGNDAFGNLRVDTPSNSDYNVLRTAYCGSFTRLAPPSSSRAPKDTIALSCPH